MDDITVATSTVFIQSMIKSHYQKNLFFFGQNPQFLKFWILANNQALFTGGNVSQQPYMYNSELLNTAVNTHPHTHAHTQVC